MSAYTALLSAIETEISDVIAWMRATLPCERYELRDPDRKPWETPNEPGYPSERHSSLLEDTDPSKPGSTKVIAVRWWPALDPLCDALERIRRYHREIGE